MPRGNPRITEEQRQEIIRRVLAGEKASALGEEFGVTRAYVSLLKMQTLEPERFAKKVEDKLTRKLTAKEMAQFEEALSTGTPESHGLIPAVERWSFEHGHQLAWKMFQKKVSVRLVKQVVSPFIKRWEDIKDEKPTPPKPHHVNQLDPELAKDKDYVKYYLSPICYQIAYREYEMALAQWEERFGEKAKEKQREAEERAAASGPAVDRRFPVPGLRYGKHSKSKGSPFTAPKRRKKRR